MKFWTWLVKLAMRHLDKNDDGKITIVYDIAKNTIVIE